MKRPESRLRLAWQLWRLCGRLVRDRGMMQGASFTVVIEGESSHAEACRIAKANGEPAPDPRTGCEVCYWPKVGDQGKVHRGETLAEAIAAALRDG